MLRYQPVPLAFNRLSRREQHTALGTFHQRMLARRTVRHYSTEPVPDALIDRAIEVAASAPVGGESAAVRGLWSRADRWPVKRQIRPGRRGPRLHFYAASRTSAMAGGARARPGTEHRGQGFSRRLHAAGLVVFCVHYSIECASDGSERIFKHYYANESVGIACGFLLAALHIAGLVTLTDTPSPMGFLTTVLQRPKNEKPFLLIPVGLPAADAEVPTITKKPLDEVRLSV